MQALTKTIMQTSGRSGIWTLVIGLLPLIGCENSIDAPIDAAVEASTESKQEVIVGALDWVGTENLATGSAERENAASVGYLSIPANNSRCTAFLISESIVMTNEHCISNENEAAGATVAFRYEQGVPFAERATYDCSTFIGDHPTLDYALLSCSGSPGAVHGVVDLDTSAADATGDDLYVIQQNCDYFSIAGCAPTKKISRGEITRIDSEYRHNADTLGGSSGSPVFSGSHHRVTALHHVGIGNNGSGRGFYNYAVPMYKVVENIQSRFIGIDLAGVDPVVVAPLEADGFEPNNTLDAANTLGASFSAEGLTITEGDVDVFAVDLPASGNLDVMATFSHAQGDLDMQVLTSDGSNPIGRSESGSDDEAISLPDLPAGRYYIVVFGYQGATAPYTLTSTLSGDDVDPPGQNPPNQAEPGDDFLGARVVTPPYFSSERIDSTDEDFFRIENNGAPLTVEIDFSHNQGDLDLVVYAIDGTVLGQSNSVSNNEIVIVPGHTGAVFVRVMGYQNAVADYDVNIR